MIFFFDANRYSSIFADKTIQNKELGSQWLASWRDIDYNVRHDLLYSIKTDKIEGTSNQAEYGSMLFVLNHIYNHAQKQIAAGSFSVHNELNWLTEATICGDSQLVIYQMNGLYKVKDQGLKPLWLEALNLTHILRKQLGVDVSFKWIPRKINNKALKIEKKLQGSCAGLSEVVVDPFLEDPEYSSEVS